MRTLVLLSALALAMPLALANPGDDHRPDRPGDAPANPGDDAPREGGPAFPGMPDAAVFGLCVAWQASETGREHGRPGSAPPFAWLQEQAEAHEQSVEAYCADRAPGSPP